MVNKKTKLIELQYEEQLFRPDLTDEKLERKIKKNERGDMELAGQKLHSCMANNKLETEPLFRKLLSEEPSKGMNEDFVH